MKEPGTGTARPAARKGMFTMGSSTDRWEMPITKLLVQATVISQPFREI